MEFLTKILSPRKNVQLDNFVDDEDFLRILCSFPELRGIVLNGDFYICCPTSSSIVGGGLSKAVVMSHILVATGQPGEFKTVNGKFCNIAGHYIVLGDGFLYTRRVRILRTSERKVNSGATVTIYHTNQPFVGGMRTPEDYDEISSVLVNKYIAALSTFPCMEVVLNEMDDFIHDMNQLGHLTKYQGFDQLQPSLRHCLLAKWKYFSQVIYSRLPIANRTTESSQLGFDSTGNKSQLSFQQIEQIVESYLLKGIGSDISKWLRNREANSHEEFMRSIEMLADISQQDLEIDEVFQTSQEESIQLLLSMPQRTVTPTDKLLFMKEVVLAIQERVDLHLQEMRKELLARDSSIERDLAMEKLEEVDFAADDLIPILIWVLLQAFRKQPEIYFDFMFVRHFHFVQATTSPIAFTTCHYDVALEWLSRSENFPAKVTASLDNFGSKESISSSSSVRKNIIVEDSDEDEENSVQHE